MDEILSRIGEAELNADGKMLAHVIWALSSGDLPGVTLTVDWDVVLPVLQE